MEGMTDGFDVATSYGHIDGIDDPSMGWARYAQVPRLRPLTTLSQPRLDAPSTSLLSASYNLI